MAKDPTTGKTDYKPVVNTFIIPHTELFTLTYKDNAGDEYELKVSGEHPFWVVDKGWLSVRQLAINDKLLITDDTEVTIINLTSEKAESGKTFTTYNFEVDDFHTYYVLQEGKKDGVFAVLVHNCKSEFLYRAVSKNELKSMKSRARFGLSQKPGSSSAKWVGDKTWMKESRFRIGNKDRILVRFEVKPGTLKWLKSLSNDYSNFPGEKSFPKGIFTKSNEVGAFGIGNDLLEEFNSRILKVKY